MRKCLTERNVSMINVENIIQKKKLHDENCRNQNITSRKKNITDISIFRIQKKQKCVFNHNIQILK